jgi:hypothetical protein
VPHPGQNSEQSVNLDMAHVLFLELPRHQKLSHAVFEFFATFCSIKLLRDGRQLN